MITPEKFKERANNIRTAFDESMLKINTAEKAAKASPEGVGGHYEEERRKIQGAYSRASVGLMAETLADLGYDVGILGK